MLALNLPILASGCILVWNVLYSKQTQCDMVLQLTAKCTTQQSNDTEKMDHDATGKKESRESNELHISS